MKILIILSFLLFSNDLYSQIVETSSYKNKSVSIISSNIINFSNNNLFKKTLSEDVVFSMINIVRYQTIKVYITNPSTYTVAWNDEIFWKNGLTPTQTANSTDKYTFIKIGEILYGTQETNFK